MAMLSDGAEHVGLEQGLAFGLMNLTWATGQAIGDIGGSRLGEAAGDEVAYLLLSAICVATFASCAQPRSAGPQPFSAPPRTPACRGGSRRRAARRRARARSRTAAQRPVVGDDHVVPALPQPARSSPPAPRLDLDRARRRLTRVERAREVVGVEHRRVDRLLQVQAEHRVGEEELERPLVLLVAARRAERQHGAVVAHAPCDGDSVVRGRTPRHQRRRQALLEPEHLRPRARGRTRAPGSPATTAASRPRRRARRGCRTGPRRRDGRCRRASARPRPPRPRAAAHRRERGVGPRAGAPAKPSGDQRPPRLRVLRATAAAPAAPAPSRRTTPPGPRTRASRPRSPCARARRPGTARVVRRAARAVAGTPAPGPTARS